MARQKYRARLYERPSRYPSPSVSRHAVMRFVERSAREVPIGMATKEILKLWKKGIGPPRKDTEVRYFDGWELVCRDNLIVTVFRKA